MGMLSQWIYTARKRKIYSMTMLYPLALLVIIYIAIMCLVLRHICDNFDLPFMRYMHEVNGVTKPQKPKIRRLMLDTTALGGDTFLVIMTLLVIGVSELLDDRLFLHSFLITALSARLLGFILKKIVNRKRPALRNDTPQMFTTSFPSVHSMMAMAIFGWLGFLMPQFIGITPNILLQILCTTLIGTIAYSRLYLAVHWPSDVIAGLIAGLIIILSIYVIHLPLL